MTNGPIGSPEATNRRFSAFSGALGPAELIKAVSGGFQCDLVWGLPGNTRESAAG